MPRSLTVEQKIAAISSNTGKERAVDAATRAGISRSTYFRAKRNLKANGTVKSAPSGKSIGRPLKLPPEGMHVISHLSRLLRTNPDLVPQKGHRREPVSRPETPAKRDFTQLQCQTVPLLYLAANEVTWIRGRTGRRVAVERHNVSPCSPERIKSSTMPSDVQSLSGSEGILAALEWQYRS